DALGIKAPRKRPRADNHLALCNLRDLSYSGDGIGGIHKNEWSLNKCTRQHSGNGIHLLVAVNHDGTCTRLFEHLHDALTARTERREIARFAIINERNPGWRAEDAINDCA